MPANMSSSSTRATRSRYSSPQITSNGTTDPVKGATTANVRPDGQRTLKDWLEPPLNSKASYQDAGLMKHGVVENMAPLGTMPKVGLFKKSAAPASTPAPENKTPSRKIILKRPVPPTPVAAPPVAAAATPAPAPAPEEDETEEEEEALDDHRDHRGFDLDESGRPALTRRSLQSREDMDDEWAPGRSSYRARSRRSTSRASNGRVGSISSSSYQQGPPSYQLADLKELADQVMEKAVDEALKSFRYPTAFALRTIYDEKRDEEGFLRLLVKVFQQTANPDEFKEFARLMAPKKREGKKGNKACYYFVPPATNNRFPPHEPKIAPYAHLVKVDLSPLRQITTIENQSDPEVLPGPTPETITEPEQPEPEPVVEPEREAEAELAAEPVPGPKLEASPEPEPQVERVSKRELPQDDEQQQQQGAEQEVHVRKKRRSNRHSTSTSKMTNGINGKGKTTSPSKRRTRANSQSSTSSLSSARSMTPPEVPQQEDEEMDTQEMPPSRASPAAGPTPGDGPTTTKQTVQKGRRRSAAVRRATRGNASSEPPTSKASTPAATQPASSKQPTPAPQPDGSDRIAAEQPYDMPAVVDSPQFPNPNPKKGGKGVSNAITFVSKIGKIDENDEKLLLRQSARAVTRRSEAAAEESYARGALALEDATPAPPSRSRASLPAVRATPIATTTTSRTRSAARKRSRDDDEAEDQASPITATFAASEAAPSTAANSRAGTPALRPANKRAKTGLRVKNSPVKKKGSTAAGIPRPSGERNSPGAVQNREDDNDDYCSSCSGNGQLICCDGCTRSFHFSCVHPPLNPDSMPEEGQWFCNVCQASRDPAALPKRTGVFRLLDEKLDAKNSSAFRLPASVRDLFEGVRTGPDGEYEEIVNVPKGPKKKKSDEDAITDLFRLRDAEGNLVICHNCHKSAERDRSIIPCSVCGLHWHLDCLDPPLANPPVLRTWRCPCHIEEVLSKVPGTLGPAHKFRKIKNTPVISPAYSRGYVNNGYIEIELEDDEDQSGWKDVESYGRTVRLPEKGIKLDFLSRVRENRKGKPIPPLRDGLLHAPVAARKSPIDKATLEHQQAAYNLAQFSGQGTAPLDNLVDALLAQADPDVISLMARARSENLTANQALDHMDEQGLRAMYTQVELMKSRITQLLNPGTPEKSSPQPATGLSGAAQAQAQSVRVPSLTHSQTTDGDSENPVTSHQTPGGIGLDSADRSKEKNLPSPAATDVVMATSKIDEDKPQTPSGDGDDDQLGSSPADENTTAEDNIPVTPTDGKMMDGNDSVVVKEPHSEKTAVEIEDDGMDLD